MMNGIILLIIIRLNIGDNPQYSLQYKTSKYKTSKYKKINIKN